MVRWPAAWAAADYAAEHPALAVGLHVDLQGEWVCEDGRRGLPLYEVVPLDDPAEVEDEVSDEIEVFRRISSGGRLPISIRTSTCIGSNR